MKWQMGYMLIIIPRIWMYDAGFLTKEWEMCGGALRVYIVIMRLITYYLMYLDSLNIVVPVL